MYSVVFILFSYILLQVDSKSGLKIINNVIAEENEYPFIVRLERRILLTFYNRILAENNVHICTCTALSRTFSLTAGHCLNGVGSIKNFNDSLSVQTVIRYGPKSDKIAEVISVIHHPSFHNPELKIRTNIGLVRTELIELTEFAKLGTKDISGLENRVVILAGYKAIKKSVRIGIGVLKASRLQLLRAAVMPYHNRNISTLPMTCAIVHCFPTSTTCDGDSGGPLLHLEEILGISTTSLEYIKGCSELNKTPMIGSEEIITLTKPHIKWINDSMRRDDQIPQIPTDLAVN